MDRQSISTSSWVSALAPEAGLQTEASARRIGFALEDAALAAALRRLVLVRRDVSEADPEDAAVIVTDRPIGEADMPYRGHVLVVGTDGRPNPGHSAIRTLDPSQILAAATLVAAGHRIEPDNRNEPDFGAARLSARERQVASLLVEGASNKLIARRLGISVHTAKFHVAAVLEKLGARNRADAVAIVLRDSTVEV